MQYILVDKNESLSSISKVVGSQNVDSLLSENGLSRSPKIGKQWKDKCDDLLSTNPPDVTAARKSALLNGLTGSEEVFEKACLMDEDEWKIFSAFGSFKDTLRVPETVKLPYSSKVIGDTVGSNVILGSVQQTRYDDNTRYGERSSNTTSYSGSNLKTSVSGDSGPGRSASSNPVDPVAYRAVMQSLKNSPIIDPGVFNSVNSSPSVGVNSNVQIQQSSTLPFAYNLPWGKIQIYSSLLQDVMDFPAYPEELSTERSATYTSMPDVIYQYEPWIVYQSSGPREQSLSFHLHRDMWSGNHLDGKAKDLIRFCEANTFPRYSGSAVLAPRVRIYIDGSLFISGVLTQTQVKWSGPIGLDNWYLEFELSLTIQEVSETALNIDTVRKFGLIGG